MSQSRRLRRANGMKRKNVCKALESDMPLNSLYALIPRDRLKALDSFVRCFGLDPSNLKTALNNELNSSCK